MTTIMRQVTCSLCDEKIDESNWEEHIISTTHLIKSHNINSKIIKSFFEVVIDSHKSRAVIFEIENNKVDTFWSLYLPTKIPKEKFDKLPRRKDRLGDRMSYLTPHFFNFLWELTPNKCEKYFNVY